ncbi:ABC transporter family substrate-binding protein [Solihabitans fulvus]|uniref:ABC transporter family substrate-binding protein n=1 Tax=Solihabitans fulvus TaxID=1892852 RepID=A0A5B2XJ36_9PSEU|nr:ABC transporter family substrate-binding protein [Solihabitans fulvus]KAA2262830.1 ABC transporter family substrate-binding protein [Solihabitans fulvus]
MSRVPRRLAMVAAPITAALMLLTACGGSGTNSNAPAPKAALGQNDINPQDVANLKDGGELKYPVQDYPVQFNELQGDATSGDIPPITRSMMPTPSIEKADGTFTANKDYVDSIELKSKDPQQVVYKLNHKAKWSDGTPITWADYKSQWQAVSGKDKAFVVLSSSGYSAVSDITKGADDYEFTINFQPKYAEWFRLFQVLYPKSMTSNPDEFNKGWAEKPKVTGGPFKFGQADPTAKTVIVVRDDNWWGDRPKLDRIIFRNISTTGGAASMDALASGELDFSGIAGNLDAYKKAQTIPGVVFRKATLPNMRWVLFNGSGDSVVKDPELRKAIIRGIDVASITKAEVSQLIPDAKPLGNHIILDGFPGYQDNSAGYTYDAEAAKKKLDELGWKLDGQFRKKDGKQLTVRDVVPAGNKASDEEAKLVQNQLAAIGVEVKIDEVSNDGFFDKQVIPGNFDITHFANMDVTNLDTTTVDYKLGDGGDQNYGKVGNDKINALIAQASEELDDAKRMELFNQIDKQVWDLGHSLPLYRRPSIVAIKDKLANFGNEGLAATDYTKIGWLK